MSRFYYSDMILAPLVTLLLLLSWFTAEVSCFLLIFAGFALWTFLEYALHWLSHELRYVQHIKHHQNPRGQDGPSFVESFSLLGLLAAFCVIFFGEHSGSLLLAGFLLGYSTYLWMHNAIHFTTFAGQSKTRLLHESHHVRNGKANFGVITTFWDRIFGTYERLK